MSKLSKEDNENINIIKLWKVNFIKTINYHKALRNRFWKTIKKEGSDSNLSSTLYLDIINKTNDIDREVKILLRKIQIIEELLIENKINEIKKHNFDFFKLKEKYLEEWNGIFHCIEAIDAILPEGIETEEF